MHVEHGHYSQSHEEQGYSEQWVEFADKFVDREKGGEHIVGENHYDPEHLVETVRSEHCQQVGGIVDENRAHKNHQQQGEHAHHSLYFRPEFGTDNLRQ